MSLQVWLPLNGNINNQGVLDVSTSGAPASWSNGKIGKCATFTGNIANRITTPDMQALRHTNNFSYCVWLNQNYSSESGKAQFAFTYGRADAGSHGYGIQIRSTNIIACWFGTRVTEITCPASEWHHIAVTVSGTTIKYYVDGILSKTANTATLPTYLDSECKGLGLGCFHYSGDIYPYYGSMNDFRIYDHCLSAREIKEISKGLFLHYPLNNPYTTALTNKYSGDNAEGKGSSGDFTITKLSNERGYNYKFSYTGTGSSKWMSIYFPNVTFTAGKIYDYSCKTRCNSTTNVQLFFRASRVGNDWVTSMQNICEKTGVWVERHIRLKLAATSERSGSTLTTSPLIEFYTNNMSTKGGSYAVNVDIKDIQIAESPNNTDIPFMDGRFVDTTMMDTAGYRCTASPSGSIGLSSNTPRYDASYVFDSKAYFKSTQPVISPSQFSVSFWVYPISCGTYSTVIANAGDPSTGFWIAVNTEGSGLWFYNGSYAKSNKGLLSMNKWYHAVFVFNNGVCTWYQNGENAGSADLSGRTKTLGISNTIAIGNSYTGSSWNTNFNGCLSDVRMYATALSAADVKELYNTPISLTNTGVLMTQGEFKEV